MNFEKPNGNYRKGENINAGKRQLNASICQSFLIKPGQQFLITNPLQLMQDRCKSRKKNHYFSIDQNLNNIHFIDAKHNSLNEIMYGIIQDRISTDISARETHISEVNALNYMSPLHSKSLFNHLNRNGSSDLGGMRLLLQIK